MSKKCRKMCRSVGCALWLWVVLCVASCDRGDKPRWNGDGGPETPTGKVSIAYIKSLYVGSPVMIADQVYVEGRIVGTDMYGNLYKTLVLEDESGGVAVMIDRENYNRKFLIGHKVRMACNSLVVSGYGGLPRIGVFDAGATGYEVGLIPEGRLDAIFTLLKGSEPQLSPRITTIDALRDGMQNTLVRFDDVQFIERESGLAWCDWDADTESHLDTDRHLTDRNGNELIVRTSRNAHFANFLLPHGSGSIEGVLGYFNGSFQLIVSMYPHMSMELPRFAVREK